MSEDEKPLLVEVESIGDTADEGKGRLSLASFEVGNVAGLDADTRRQFTLRQPMSLTLLLQHLTESVLCVHRSYSSNSAKRSFT